MYKLYRQKIKGGIAVDEIKVGDCIRTNDGQIGKLIRIERDDIDTSLKWYVFNDNKNERYVNKPYITNHSKNIIDLIEAEDYINGNRVYKVTSNCIYCIGKAIQNKSNINIKTILTKEQYERNCYRLENNEC